MAMIEEVLYARLSGFAALAALVGARIYPIILPKQCPLPALTYRRVITEREPMISRDTGTAEPHFEITAWAEEGNYEQLLAVVQQVRFALQRWHDDALGVEDVNLVDEEEDFHPEVLCFYRRMFFQVTHQEELP